MNRYILLLLLALPPALLQAQSFKVYGKVTNSKLEPLSFVTVEVYNTKIGTITGQDGTFSLQLEAGRYDLVVSMVGYKSRMLSIVVRGDYQQNVLLEEDAARDLEEVVVKGRFKDRAEEIIRQVIRRKEAVEAAAGPYSCTLYIKAVQQDSGFLQHKNKPAPKDTVQKPVAGYGGMGLAEILLQLDRGSDRQLREERLAVKTVGNPGGLFYLSATDGDFNFYNNLVKVPGLSTTPFLSPISYSGLVAYKFKTLKTQQSGKYRIYTISVKPRQTSNATVTGELVISDSAWVVLQTRLQLPRYHLAEYDFFEVQQHYGAVGQQAWMLLRQQFSYASKGGRKKLSGQTSVTYTDYRLHQQFGKRHFGPEVSATAREAYEKDSTFWQTARTEPLTAKEIGFIRFRDSVYRATHTKAYLDSVDRERNRVTLKKVAFEGQEFYKRARDRTWRLPSLVSVYQPFAFGGSRINPFFSYYKVFPSRKNISVNSNLSYGIRNRDVNGSVHLTRMYNPFNRGFYTLSLSRDFQFIYEGDAWINMLRRNNYYLSNNLSFGHGLELVNGLFLYTDMDLALRRSLSNYKTGTLVDSAFSDWLQNNQAIAFTPYNAVYGKIRLAYTPRQRYIREPLEKLILGSSWPTFYVSLRKGIPGLMNSRVDFDYLEFGMEQEVKAGLAGNARYSVKTGSFINQKELRLVDYQFQRRGDPLLFMNPDHAFQALDSTFPLFNRFYQGHFVHEFNGALFNKLVLFKHLKLREVAGAGFLLAPERNLRYGEAFAGVERVFKWPFNNGGKFKLGAYVVGSVANQFRNPIQFKVGVTSWDRRRNRWF